MGAQLNPRLRMIVITSLVSGDARYVNRAIYSGHGGANREGLLFFPGAALVGGSRIAWCPIPHRSEINFRATHSTPSCDATDKPHRSAA